MIPVELLTMGGGAVGSNRGGARTSLVEITGGT